MTNEILIKTKGRGRRAFADGGITVTISRYSPWYFAKRDNPHVLRTKQAYIISSTGRDIYIFCRFYFKDFSRITSLTGRILIEMELSVNAAIFIHLVTRQIDALETRCKISISHREKTAPRTREFDEQFVSLNYLAERKLGRTQGKVHFTRGSDFSSIRDSYLKKIVRASVCIGEGGGRSKNWQ